MGFTSSTFGCNGIGGLPISSFFTMLLVDGHRGSVGLTLYPLHRVLWFVTVPSVSIVDSSQYAIYPPYSVFTLVIVTITKKLWRPKNPHQTPRGEHSSMMPSPAYRLLTSSHIRRETSIPYLKVMKSSIGFSSARTGIDNPPTSPSLLDIVACKVASTVPPR